MAPSPWRHSVPVAENWANISPNPTKTTDLSRLPPHRWLAARLVAWASRSAACHAVAVAPQHPESRKLGLLSLEQRLQLKHIFDLFTAAQINSNTFGFNLQCRYPLGYLQCLAPLVGADLDFDVRWIRPPVDWGGG